LWKTSSHPFVSKIRIHSDCCSRFQQIFDRLRNLNNSEDVYKELYEPDRPSEEGKRPSEEGKRSGKSGKSEKRSRKGAPKSKLTKSSAQSAKRSSRKGGMDSGEGGGGDGDGGGSGGDGDRDLNRMVSTLRIAIPSRMLGTLLLFSLCTLSKDVFICFSMLTFSFRCGG
jgi:hypothetical protein